MRDVILLSENILIITFTWEVTAMLDTLMEGALGTVTDNIVSFVWQLAAALIVFLIGYQLIKFLHRFLAKALGKSKNLDVNMQSFLLQGINIILYVILAFIVAEMVGISSATILALVGSVGIAIGMSLQGSLSNVAGGILILVTHPYMLGDYIMTDYGDGTVTSIGILYTTLTTIDNRVITIPNGTLSNSAVTNLTGEPKRRIDLQVGITYDSDLELAKELLKKAYYDTGKILPDEPFVVYVASLGDHSVNIGARGWVATPDYYPTLWAIQENVKLEYDKAGVVIAFNQLDVHIRDESAKA